LKIENVPKLGNRAHYLAKTNNFERKIRDKELVFGELTVLDGHDVHTGYVTPPSKTKARDAVKNAIDRNRRRPA
jgi:hypothetical protein